MPDGDKLRHGSRFSELDVWDCGLSALMKRRKEKYMKLDGMSE